jgi:4-hydroxy-4-methyl-2-oxoglutarate aldolase
MTPSQTHTASRDQLLPMLHRVTCSAMVDAMSQRHAHPAHVLDLVSPTPGRVLFGRAVTVRYNPVRKDVQHPVHNNFASLFYRAIEAGGIGAVLVLSNGGHPDSALGGGRKLSRLRHTGLAGVLADGRLRDFEALSGYAFATYCRGQTVRQGGNLIMPVEANVPVEIGGVGVLPGDWIYADATGAVVVPDGDIVGVLEDAAGFEERDAASAERMIHEDPATVMAQGEAR